MNPRTDKKAKLTEKYYAEFIEQNSEGIFRIEFKEPISVDSDLNDQCETFYRCGLIAGFNQAFAQNLKLFSERPLTDQTVSGLKNEFETLNEKHIRKFFEANFKPDGFETCQTGITGNPIYFLNSLLGVVKDGKLVCVWGKINDITAQKVAQQTSLEFEKYWQKTQKIEALGRLAGGIAHDFNNFLAVMMLQNDMLNLQLPKTSPLRHRIEEMKKATNNATAMVKQLLAVGRKQTLHPKPVEVNNSVNEFTKLLPTIVPENVETVITLDPDSGVCFIDQNQLIQTLANLSLNAKEAMPEGGTLKIETTGVVLDKNSIRHKSQPEGLFVQITISDTGIGMDSANLESVFEPFFSTKKSAKGVGLGLATVYGFIKQSKGFIWIDSELGRGTTIKIQFPRIDQPIQKEQTNS
jgi:nitrogen-specific signal transduction histidine kinase